MAGGGDDSVGVGGIGGSGDELLTEVVKADAMFGLEGGGFVFDVDDGLVIADGNVWIWDSWFCHHKDDVGALGG